MDPKKKWRVKVYQLDEKDQWEDKGTGQAQCFYMEKFKGLGIVVKSEADDNVVLLEQKVYTEPDTYNIQQDSLIVWNEPDTDQSLALSFQEPAGCFEIWELLVGPDRKDPMDVDKGLDLPPVNLANIDKLGDIFAVPPSMRDKLVSSLLNQNYLPKFVELFHVLEQQNDTSNLHKLFNIFKTLVLLNDTTLFEAFFAESFIFDLMGIFEYDPDLPQKQKHREYLKNVVVFKEVIPFKNPEIVTKIHQTFRIQYLKDVVLPRYLDELTFGTLNSWIGFSHVEIVNHIQKDEKFLHEMFDKIRKTEDKKSLKDLLDFLQDLCNLAKNMTIHPRVQFYQSLCEHGIPEILEKILHYDDASVRLSLVNTAECVISHDPSLIRNVILGQKPHYSLLKTLLQKFMHDPDSGVRLQMTEILRVLLDMTNEGTEKDEFLALFYGEFVSKLLEPFNEKEASVSTSADDSIAGVKENLLDLLAFFSQHHGHWVKYFILGNNVISKALKLLKSKEKHLVIAAVRFFRAIVGLKDESYNKHITKHNLFEPIVQAFKANGNKYNLLNSSILDLFDFIRKENIKPLVQNLWEEFGTEFKDINYVSTFELLKLKYEQNMHSSTSVSSNGPSLPTNQPPPESEEEEEYFKESDSEDDESKNGNLPKVTDQPKPAPKLKPLVPYAEDEESPWVLAADKSPRMREKSPESSKLGVKGKPKISFNLKSNLGEDNNGERSPSPNGSPSSSPLSSPKRTFEEVSSPTGLEAFELSPETLNGSPKRQKT